MGFRIFRFIQVQAFVIIFPLLNIRFVCFFLSLLSKHGHTEAHWWYMYPFIAIGSNRMMEFCFTIHWILWSLGWTIEFSLHQFSSRTKSFWDASFALYLCKWKKEKCSYELIGFDAMGYCDALHCTQSLNVLWTEPPVLISEWFGMELWKFPLDWYSKHQLFLINSFHFRNS